MEACYCLEGEGTVEEFDSGKFHDIKPGTDGP
jgi:L-ectoine synthase